MNMSPAETQQSNEENDSMVGAAEKKPITKSRIYKNLLVVSLGTMIALGTDDVLLTLQTTINSEEGIGVTSIALQCAVICFTSLLLPKYLIYKIGSKAVMILGIVSFIPFFLANYQPSWLAMLASSLFIGVGFSLLWSAVCPYLNDLSGLYVEYSRYKEENSGFPPDPNTQELTSKQALLKPEKKFSKNEIEKCSIKPERQELESEKTNFFHTRFKSKTYVIQEEDQVGKEKRGPQLDSITARFFGFHSMVYQTCYIWSSLLSYYILQTDSEHRVYLKNLNCSCGAAYCNMDMDCLETNLKQPSDLSRNFLISLCIALTFGAALFVGIFLESFKPKETNVAFSVDLLLATLKQTKKRGPLLLIPLTMYTGMIKGFYIGDFTKFYIGCAWDIRHIGLVTAVSGIAMAFSSSVSGWLVKYTGMFNIFLIGGLLNVLFNVMLLVWKPDRQESYMFFVASGSYGFLYGLFFTQLRAYYGILFKEDEEAAFAGFGFWNGLGECMCLLYSNYICNSIKVYILIAFSILGIFGYIILEKTRPQELGLPKAK